ncbi:hypothetical protein IP84_04530 [beta proteobacterium AAP99]|nr:hypothetical protein IP84_04530 [beta proteobacterium AAP99]
MAVDRFSELPAAAAPATGLLRPPPALLSVVLPALNEADSLAALVPTLCDTLRASCQRLEILVVDDGSTDGTRVSVLRMRARGLPVRLLSLSRNFGKEAALTAGLLHARGEVVLSMDSDGQHPVQAAVQMLQRWRAGADVVYGVQVGRGPSQGWARRWLTGRFYRLMGRGARVSIPENAGDFRVLDRRVIEALRQLPERTRYMKGLFAWVGFRSEPVKFIPSPRTHGRTHFRWRALFALAFSGITSFTRLPLRLVSALGVLVSAAAVAYGIWVAIEELVFGIAVPGYPTIVVSILMLSGVQLLSLGIIGEYVGHIFDEVKGRPLYLIDFDSDPPRAARDKADA